MCAVLACDSCGRRIPCVTVGDNLAASECLQEVGCTIVPPDFVSVAMIGGLAPAVNIGSICVLELAVVVGTVVVETAGIAERGGDVAENNIESCFLESV